MKVAFLVIFLLVALFRVQAQPQCPACARTQGYWTTHDSDGPVQRDCAWDCVTGQLCGQYSYESVLDNQDCMDIGNDFWCAVARQYVAMRMNFYSGNGTCGQCNECSAQEALGSLPALLAAYTAAGAELCKPTPQNFTAHSDWVQAFDAYNNGAYTNGPCHCGDPGCNPPPPPPPNPEPECELICKCDTEHENVTIPGNRCGDYCALTQGFWKNHPANNNFWQSHDCFPDEVVTLLCNASFYDIWAEPVSGNKWLILAHQYMAAIMNINTAPYEECIPDVVADALAAAANLLAVSTDCNRVLTADEEVWAVGNATILDQFNNGNIGNVSDCEDGPKCHPGPDDVIVPGEPICVDCEFVLDCCPDVPPPEDCGCTLTQCYWKNHEDQWPVSVFTELCDLSFMTILTTPPAGNGWYILAHQWIAATLNHASGACLKGNLPSAMAEAEQLLKDNCVSLAPNQVSALSDLLDSYNNGNEGVPHCGSTQYRTEVCPAPCPPPPPHVCEGGCTLTQGYWKNHYEMWPAEYKDAMICGTSWLVLFNTAPKSGDAFLILAHQFMAARLNVEARGSCMPDSVAEQLQIAAELLYACDDSLFVKGTSTRAQAIYAAAVLDGYNNGQFGPGHCDSLQLLNSPQSLKKRQVTSDAAEELLGGLIISEEADSAIQDIAGDGRRRRCNDDDNRELLVAILVIACILLCLMMVGMAVHVFGVPTVFSQWMIGMSRAPGETKSTDDELNDLIE